MNTTTKWTTEMRKSKFEYFINAVVYSLDRMMDATGSELIYKFVFLLIRFIRLFLPKNLRQRFDIQLKRNESVMPMIRRHSCYVNAKQFIQLLCVFLTFFFFIFTHILFKRLKSVYPQIVIPIDVIIIFILIIFYFLLFTPISNAIDEDVYMGYAKIFDKKDKDWHTKWRLITIFLSACILSSVFIVL